MFNKREWIIFFAGAEAFHTLSHVLITLNGVLPIAFFGFVITRSVNLWAILINVAITIWLLMWARKIKR